MSNATVSVNISQIRTNTPTIVSFVGRNTLLGFTSSIRINSIGFEISDIASRSQLQLDFDDPSLVGQFVFREQ